jgi:cytochrome c55X
MLSAMHYYKYLLGVISLVASGLIAPALAGEDRAVPQIRERELVRLVRQDCGSCHGMQLTGGLGQALTPDNLRDKPMESLVATVLYGRPGTAMPPWKTIISEADAAWIVEQLMSGFPKEGSR